GAEALVHPIASARDIEPSFDAIAYDKGAAVLAMFEQFVGPDAFQAAVRRYLAAHAGTSVDSRAFLDALAARTRPEIAEALATNLGHAGTPVVELAVRCDDAGGAPAEAPATATLVASARDGVVVPICVRYPVGAGQTRRLCLLAASHTEQPLPAASRCPTWIAGNDGGRGYYRTVWRGPAPLAPVAALSPEERLARGDDAALAVERGDASFGDALAELTTLATSRDPYGEFAALELASAIDGLAPDAARPAWRAFLARRFAGRLTRAALLHPHSVIDYAVRSAVVGLARDAVDPGAVAAVRAVFDPRSLAGWDRVPLVLATTRAGGGLFDAVVRAAAAGGEGDAREAALGALGAFPPAFAPRVVDVLLDRRFPADQVWPALVEMLSRGEARSAAWRAIHARFAGVAARLGRDGMRDALAALSVLCDADARAELAGDAAPLVGATSERRRILDRSLATIDRCLARRAAAGDLASALAAARL
ncbi:MAG TPA: ERAP1-like C-terminal domain-containing protein, partial [Kofleriaceae bacterium]|nr:ERAP1-like C-terminal domain-containing protein [Kofleriaceae bacterium]